MVQHYLHELCKCVNAGTQIAVKNAACERKTFAIQLAFNAEGMCLHTKRTSCLSVIYIGKQPTSRGALNPGQMVTTAVIYSRYVKIIASS